MDMPRGTKDRRRPENPFCASSSVMLLAKDRHWGGMHRGASNLGGTLGVTLPCHQPHIKVVVIGSVATGLVFLIQTQYISA
ncbi:hypothetical protein TNCT_534711 [Trichonephila clavata]|uniref:Uncharacterized protein n=1 Tax=Trichonephila clavata TaxID=2740835 RepID=A0A8X6KCZ1_TRICU|nr:hypothetical protein TNCT_534711 [Trichonephila clavata]